MTTFLLFYLCVALLFANGSVLYHVLKEGYVEDRYYVRAGLLWPLLAVTTVVVAVLTVVGFVGGVIELGYRLLKPRVLAVVASFKARFKRA